MSLWPVMVHYPLTLGVVLDTKLLWPAVTRARHLHYLMSPLIIRLNMKKAFTIIELLIYMALLGLFLIVLTNILVTALQSQTESTTASLVDIDSRFILNRLAYDIAQAGSITTPSAPGQTASSIVLNTNTFSISGTNLLLSGVQLNSYDSQVSDFSATRIGNNLGKDTLMISFTVSSGELSRSYTTTLGLR